MYGKWQTIHANDANKIQKDLTRNLTDFLQTKPEYITRLTELSKFQEGKNALETIKRQLIGQINKRDGFAIFDLDERDTGLSKYYFDQCQTSGWGLLNLIKRFFQSFVFEDLSVYTGAFSYSASGDYIELRMHTLSVVEKSILNNAEDFEKLINENTLLNTQPPKSQWEYYSDQAFEMAFRRIIGSAPYKSIKALYKAAAALNDPKADRSSIMNQLIIDLNQIIEKGILGAAGSKLKSAIENAHTDLNKAEKSYLTIANDLLDATSTALMISICGETATTYMETAIIKIKEWMMTPSSPTPAPQVNNPQRKATDIIGAAPALFAQ